MNQGAQLGLPPMTIEKLSFLILPATPQVWSLPTWHIKFTTVVRDRPYPPPRLG